MKRFSLLITFALSLCQIWAQGPNESGTYYQNANGKKGEALKTALAGIINPHKSIGYDGLYEAYKKTDTRADGYVRDWYSNTTNYRHGVDNKGNYKNEGDMYNREHTVPQSWFEDHGSGSIIKCDIVHVVPTDGKINGMRGNNPFGEISNISGQSNNGYCKWGPCKLEGYSNTVFEPNDEIKGDLARIYFYMATCYETLASSWGNSVFTGTKYQPFSTWTFNMLIRWAQEDPIDDIEIARNNAVYETQENRNPFVDYPGLENYIWGDKKDVAFSYDNYEGGGGTVVVPVAMPVFSPDAGTYYEQVTVTLTCATEGAAIYYTTTGAEPTTTDQLYEGPFVLTESTTVKAIAIKDEDKSSVATATYTISEQGGGGEPTDGEAVLNNTFFGYTGSGTINKSNAEDLVGTKDGITLTYALGSGGQRYVTDSEIRVYTGNTLTVSVAQGTLTEMEFTIGTKTSPLSANTGSFNGFKWTGNAKQVIVTSSNNTSVKNIKYKVSTSTGIESVSKNYELAGQRVIYNLRGQRVTKPSRGLYIVDGKKIFIE